jgi:hypothetical protein
MARLTCFRPNLSEHRREPSASACLLDASTGFTEVDLTVKWKGMSTITAILEPDADGTLHLPLPDHLRHGMVKVVASLESASETAGGTGTPLEALKELRKLGAFEAVADPVAWQRDERKDRTLPGRDE